MAQPKYAGEDRGSELQAQRRASAMQRVGQTVAEVWHLDALVGLGGSAAVYSASHRDGRSPAAIKVLHADLAVLPTVGRRFLREAYVANRVAHPGAPVVLDDGMSGEGTPYLVLELLKGRSLDARGREGPAMAVGEVLSLARGVLEILAAAHAKGVVHRDVKPSNIFLTESGSVHLLDFGIARMRAAEEAGEVTTQSGLLIGTPQFMAPEQARGHTAALDARTDLWALGAVMFWLLTGRYVHTGATALEIIIASATQPAPRLAPTLGGPPAVAVLVDRALAFNPKGRWQNALEMQAAIDDVAQKLSPEEREVRPGAGTGAFSGEGSPPTLDELEEGHSDDPAVASKVEGLRSAPAPGPAKRWTQWGMLAGAAAIVLAASLRLGGAAGAGREGESGQAKGPSGPVGEPSAKLGLGGLGGPKALGSVSEAMPSPGERAVSPGEATGGRASPGEATSAAAASEAPTTKVGGEAKVGGEVPIKVAVGATSGRKRGPAGGGHEGGRPAAKGAGGAAPGPSLEDPHAPVPDEVLDRRK